MQEQLPKNKHFFTHLTEKSVLFLVLTERLQQLTKEFLKGGTAVICDAGRTGSQNSVGGLDAKSCINEYLTQIPDWSRETWDTIELQGVVVNVDENRLSYGKAVSIERVKFSVQQEKEDM